MTTTIALLGDRSWAATFREASAPGDLVAMIDKIRANLPEDTMP
jgi:hypothetical protein